MLFLPLFCEKRKANLEEFRFFKAFFCFLRQNPQIIGAKSGTASVFAVTLFK